MAPTIPDFQGSKICIQYMDSQSHKNNFYISNYYDGSNVIRLTWRGNQFEDYTTHVFIKCHQYTDHARILNRSL